MTQTPSVKTQQMQVGGMDCGSCAAKIEAGVQKIPGVAQISVSVATERLSVTYDPNQVSEQEIRDRVISLGFTIISPEVHDHDHDHSHRHGSGEFNLKQELLPVLGVVVLLMLGIIFEKPLHNTPYSIAEYAVFIPAYLISGSTVLKAAGRNILRGQVFDENFLMTIATLGAIAIHQLPEAVAVMLFFRIGELFQEYAVGRSRRSIKSVLEVRPDTANLKLNGTLKAVSPETVNVGDIIVVKPGEKIPFENFTI